MSHKLHFLQKLKVFLWLYYYAVAISLLWLYYYSMVVLLWLYDYTILLCLSIFIESVLYDIVIELLSRIKDTNHMLDIIDNLKSLDLPLNSILISFYMINMFSNIHNKLRLSSVTKYLDLCSKSIPPTNFFLEALELCLTRINSIFNNENYLQIYGTHAVLLCRYCYGRF